MSRRDFMAAAGASAAAMQVGAMGLAAATAAEKPQPAKRPLVRVAFLRPDTDHFWNTWPGADYDPKAHQAEYVKMLAETAELLGTQIDVHDVPLADDRAVGAFAEQVKTAPPDGVILVVQILNGKTWKGVRQFIESRGETPTFVFAEQGTAFLETIQSLLPLAKKSQAFIAATPDRQWLPFGLRCSARSGG